MTKLTLLPEITLKTINGENFNLNNFVKNKPVILLFYRGGWCPFCNMQLANLQSIEKDITALGYQIIAVSPDKPEKLKESLDKHKITYILLSDSKMDAAKKMDVYFKVDEMTMNNMKKLNVNIEDYSGENHGLLPIPSVFIINKNSEIKFMYVNPDFKVRLEPSVLLEEAKKHISL